MIRGIYSTGAFSPQFGLCGVSGWGVQDRELLADVIEIQHLRLMCSWLNIFGSTESSTLGVVVDGCTTASRLRHWNLTNVSVGISCSWPTELHYLPS